jgi:AcrR family transcriptional regulator
MAPRSTQKKARPREPLSRERILAAAVDIADQHGLDDLSMRRLGQALGVEAMSLYHHVANKDDLLDGIVERVLAEVDIDFTDLDWVAAMQRRARSMREMFRRHPWALPIIETRRNAGASSHRYYDAVLGALRRAGFSIALAAHAFAVIDAFVFGFAVQEQSLAGDGEAIAELAEDMLPRVSAAQYPYFAELISEHVMLPGYDFGAEFEWGLDLILEGFGRRLVRERGDSGDSGGETA